MKDERALLTAYWISQLRSVQWAAEAEGRTETAHRIQPTLERACQVWALERGTETGTAIADAHTYLTLRAKDLDRLIQQLETRRYDN